MHPRSGRSPKRAPTAPARMPTRPKRERRIIRPRRTFPERDAHGLATRFAPHKRSPRRSSSSMLPPTVTRCDRWMETQYEEAHSSRVPRDAAKRPATTFRPNAARCNKLLRPAPPEGETGLDRLAPTSWARPSLRNPRATHSAELRRDVATSAPSARKSSAPSHPLPGTTASAGGREATLAFVAPSIGLVLRARLAANPKRLIRRVPREREHPAERAAHGRPLPTLPPEMANSERDRKRSVAHHHAPTPSASDARPRSRAV
jgi:hypothetical protein